MFARRNYWTGIYQQGRDYHVDDDDEEEEYNVRSSNQLKRELKQTNLKPVKRQKTKRYTFF